MNLKRGFFRIWLVLATLWAVATIVLFYPDVKQEFDKANIDPSKWGAVRVVPVLCKEARGVEGKDYDAGGPWNAYREEKLCTYQMPVFRKLFAEYRDLSDDDLYDRLLIKSGQQPREKPNPWGQLSTAVGVAFGVPFAFFLIGAAVGWAFAGFKRPSP